MVSYRNMSAILYKNYMEITRSIITYLTLFAGSLSLLIAFEQLIVKNRQLEHYNLFALLFCIGMLIFQTGSIVIGFSAHHPWALYGNFTMLFLVCPLIYFGYHLVVLPFARLPQRKALYFVPVLCAVAGDIYYLMLPVSDQKDMMVRLFEGNLIEHVLIFKAMYMCAWMQLMIYLGILFFKLYYFKAGRKRSRIVFITMAYIVLTLASFSLVVIGYLFCYAPVVQAGIMAICVIFIFLHVINQRAPRFLQVLMIEIEKGGYERSLLQNIDVDSILSKLRLLMEQEKIYFDDELLLKNLAEELKITPHQLSQLLNERLNTNFNNFVNQYRIEEAKKLLTEEPDKPVLAISYEVGFNSKTAFYNAFSRFVGKSPQAYRKEKGL